MFPQKPHGLYGIDMALFHVNYNHEICYQNAPV